MASETRREKEGRTCLTAQSELLIRRHFVDYWVSVVCQPASLVATLWQTPAKGDPMSAHAGWGRRLGECLHWATRGRTDGTCGPTSGRVVGFVNEFRQLTDLINETGCASSLCVLERATTLVKWRYNI